MTYEKYDTPELITLWQNNQEEAILLTLINRHKPFIENLIIKNFGYFEVDREDLIQEGIVGFLEGLNRFNKELGYELLTFIGWYVLGNITQAVRRELEERTMRKSTDITAYYDDKQENTVDLDKLIQRMDFSLKIKDALNKLVDTDHDYYKKVIDGIMEGKNMKEISEELGLNYKTAQYMKYKIIELAVTNESINKLFQELC